MTALPGNHPASGYPGQVLYSVHVKGQILCSSLHYMHYQVNTIQESSSTVHRSTFLSNSFRKRKESRCFSKFRKEPIHREFHPRRPVFHGFHSGVPCAWMKACWRYWKKARHFKGMVLVSGEFLLPSPKDVTSIPGYYKPGVRRSLTYPIGMIVLSRLPVVRV